MNGEGKPVARRYGWPRLVVALALALACDGPGVVTPAGSNPIGFGSSSATSSQVTGTWQRTIFFFDDFGFAQSSETTWQFSSDGTAVRSVVARNLTLGFADVLLATARWRVQGSQLIIDFITPTPGQIQLEFRLQGSQLILAGDTYSRVGG
jgi:hypothetical protein